MTVRSGIKRRGDRRAPVAAGASVCATIRALAATIVVVAAGCADAPGADETALDARDVASAAETHDGAAGGGAVASADATFDAAADSGSECPGGAGCPCSSNADCDASLCLLTPAGKRCARVCVADCPEGFACKTLGSGPDVITVCLPRWNRLCDPCIGSAECKADASADSLCVRHGDMGAYCATPCAAAADCPAGYACAPRKGVEGTSAQVCTPMPTPDAPALPGACTCSPAAREAGAQTTCLAQTSSGGATVACPGTRSCAETGLQPCAAAAAVTETCDGIDNDCDGATDEATCDDANPCTSEVCAAAEGCLSQKLSDVPCEADGDPCTVGDGCVKGLCIPGAAKSCDDGNPCTKDACSKPQGCVASADDGAPCSDDNPCTIGDGCGAGACVSGAAKTCDSGQPCVAAACNLATGQCGFGPAPTGKSCDDGDLCTKNDGCDGGICLGSKVTCDDANVCTDEACAADKGCSSVAATAKPCDDGNGCTVGDACQAGACLAGGAKQCNDGNPCTFDGCDQVKGTCGVIAVPDGTPCGQDGAACSKGMCLGGCKPEAKKVCQAGNVFWQDSCGKLGPMAQACEGATFCSAAACVGGVFAGSWLVTAEPDSQPMGMLGTAKFPPSIYTFADSGGGKAEAATTYAGATYLYKGALKDKIFEGTGSYSEGDLFPISHQIKLLWTFAAADPPTGKPLPDTFSGFIYDTMDTGILGTITLIWKVKGVRQ